MRVVFVTGASRGIGKGITDAIIRKYEGEEDLHLFLFSRGKIDFVTNEDAGIFVHQFSLDLSDLQKVQSISKQSFGQLPKDATISRAWLIHNAGTLGHISSVAEQEDYDAVQTMYNLNLTSCYIFTSLFLKHFKPIAHEITIVDISSGAALNPYQNWSLYCTAKTARKMLMATIAIEEDANKVRTLSYGPGIVNTDIQKDVQNSSDAGPKLFLKKVIESGQSVPVDVTSEQLIDLLEGNDFKSGQFLDFYEKQPKYIPNLGDNQ